MRLAGCRVICAQRMPTCGGERDLDQCVVDAAPWLLQLICRLQTLEPEPAA